MVRSSLLALCVLVTACTTVVVPAPSADATRPVRTSVATPVDAASFTYPAIAASFIAALNEGREADAFALLGEHFRGSDCDYQSRSIWVMSDRDNARHWLQRRIAEHDHVAVLNTLDGGSYDHALRFDVRRSSDPISRDVASGSVLPRAKLVLRFTLDGSQIVEWRWDWGRYSPFVSQFSDCMA